MNTMVTFRTDEKLKNEASHIFDSLGMSLSTAINMFLKQTVIKNTFPCSIEMEIASDYKTTYPENFFGSCKNLGLDEEPKDIPWKNEIKKEKM